ncbi:MAG: peptidoglycan DD-metalloendopeptidase family protein [Anaerolineae bacterium]|nr:peptidoglycan DD-metalloendopeptidase family protein [Anaerolineae bacterium]
MVSPVSKSVKDAFLNEWLPSIAWGIALALVGLMIVLYFRPPSEVAALAQANEPNPAPVELLPTPTLEPNISLPEITVPQSFSSVGRALDSTTIQSARTRSEVVTYTVESLDSIFGISNKFNLKPETLLWANYDVLQDNPDMLAVGQNLVIPPVDGVLYTWKEGDTIEAIAGEYYAEPMDILLFDGNNLDLTDPQIDPGTQVMIPDGYREFVQWVMPTIPRGAAGVSSTVYGAGGCTTSEDGAYGSGFFVYPTSQHRLSGNDYWSGHLALDFAVGVGDPVFASDSGVVVYSGWNTSGYGNMVMIDHGNGYQTLYAHLSNTAVRCGASVYQGQTIGYGGSTGNSTGPHLHFEVRYFGGFINPWFVLN